MSEELAEVRPLIWTNPGATKPRPSLVRLTTIDLTLAEVLPADLEEVVADLDDGGGVAGQVIPLACFAGARGDEDGALLTVRFRIGRSKEESRELAFVDRAERDDFVAALVEALGPDWGQDCRPVTRWTAGLWTLGPTAISALITLWLYLEATLIAQGKPPPAWGRNGKLRLLAVAAHWVERQLGPTGILVAGCVLVGVGLLLFFLVMHTPPKRVVVEPATHRDDGGDVPGGLVPS